MRVSPLGSGEYKDGNQVGQYGRDGSEWLFVWYHCGLDSADELAWAMETDVEQKISVSVDKLLVPSAEHGLYIIDRDKFVERLMAVDGRDQYVARASDEYVRKVGDDADDHLRGALWITPENAHGGYHQDKNEA